MTVAAILNPWSTPVLFTFCCSWTWQIETSHRPPTRKSLLPGSPPNPCPNPHVYEVNTLITTFSSHHLDHSPFAPERVPFRSHTAAIFRCHWSCSFPADHRVFGQFSLLMVHAGLCLDNISWTLWKGSHHGVYLSQSRRTPFDLLLHRQMIFGGAERGQINVHIMREQSRAVEH